MPSVIEAIRIKNDSTPIYFKLFFHFYTGNLLSSKPQYTLTISVLYSQHDLTLNPASSSSKKTRAKSRMFCQS